MNPFFPKCLFFSFIIGAALLLTSCTKYERNIDALQNYQYRMSNVLETASLRKDKQELRGRFAYPKKRDLYIPLPSSKINLLEFLKLSRCKVQRLLGQRNGSIGEVQTASQRYLYDLQFIYLGRKCLTQIDNKALAEKLLLAIELKETHIAESYWNATLASEEFIYFAGGNKPDTNLGALQESLAALENLTSFSPEALGDSARLDQPEVLSAQFERQLQVLQRAKLLRTHLKLQHHVVTALEPITQKLQETSAICPPLIPGRKAIARTVFAKYYIGQIQPLISQISRSGKRIQGSLAEITKLTHAKNPSLQAYLKATWDDSPGSMWHQYQAVTAEHTMAWQQAFKDCSIDPRSIKVEPS